jgi:hypothetical protein
VFTLTEVVAVLALVCSIVGAIVAILNLRKYRRVKFFLFVIFFMSVTGVIWIATKGFSLSNIQHIKELQEKAQNDARKAREAKAKEEDQKVYAEALTEATALLEAKKAILGAWACSTGGKIIFNANETASNELFSNVYTYKFVDSRHVEISATFGLGPTYSYDVDLTTPDQSLRWHGVVCHRSPK